MGLSRDVRIAAGRTGTPSPSLLRSHRPGSRSSGPKWGVRGPVLRLPGLSAGPSGFDRRALWLWTPTVPRTRYGLWADSPDHPDTRGVSVSGSTDENAPVSGSAVPPGDDRGDGPDRDETRPPGHVIPAQIEAPSDEAVRPDAPAPEDREADSDSEAGETPPPDPEASLP